MIIHSDSDLLVSLEAAKELKATIPNSELHILKGMGHDFSLQYVDPIAGLIAENARKAK
jgi:pimeloyl-ACP methyl ester carboxylesterase